MSERLVPKPVRKGTKSCSECRRRKVRCTWTSENATLCQNCEERGLVCEAQVFSFVHGIVKNHVSTRKRISQLETKVASLIRRVHFLEHKLGIRQDHEVDSSHVSADGEDGAEESDSSTVSELYEERPPQPLSGLFENDILSSKRQTAKKDTSDNTRAKFVAHLHDAARRALQPLIPLKEDLKVLSNLASDWLKTLDALFPYTIALLAQQDSLESYQEMQKDYVNPIRLAHWLLIIALTVQQVPQDRANSSTFTRDLQAASKFGRAVSEAFEQTILVHDSFMGSLEGLSAAMLYMRLVLSKGSFQKPWLQLRRLIAIAELIGLPQAAREVSINENADLPDAGQLRLKSQVWEALCDLERISAVTFNRPVSSRRYRKIRVEDVMKNGELDRHVYLGCLTEIAVKMQDLEVQSKKPGVEVEFYAEIIRFDQELRMLASQAPRSWWNYADMEVRDPNQILQFWHEWTALRLHLAFTLKQDLSEEFAYSRIRGTEACISVIRRYLRLRQGLPSGVFFCRMLDLEGFVAAAVILLVHYNSKQVNLGNQQNNMAGAICLVQDVITLMSEKANEGISSDYAQCGATALRSLSKLLAEDQDSLSMPKSLTIHVPLLGDIHVTRNLKVSHNPQDLQGSVPQPAQDSTRNRDGTVFSAMAPMIINNNYDTDVDNTSAWTTEPYSWSIEDASETFFQDSFLAENFDGFGGWPFVS